MSISIAAAGSSRKENGEPNINERNDGIDTMNYLVEQPWCEILGYWGHSYTSMTAGLSLMPRKERLLPCSLKIMEPTALPQPTKKVASATIS